MARDPDDIEREIELARDALASTLDELGTRANPKRVVESGKASLQTKLEDPKVRNTMIAVGAVVGLLLVRKLLR